MSKQVENGVNEAVEGRGTLRPRTARADKLRPERHQPIEPIDIKVHVAFRQCIGAQDAAFLLAEVRCLRCFCFVCVPHNTSYHREC